MQTLQEPLDLIWGVKYIAAYICRPERATFHLLAKGTLPGRVIGGRWCASRAALRKFLLEG